MSIRTLTIAALGLWLAFSQATAAESTDRYVTFKTDLGKVIIRLYPERAPKTVDNFLQYVDSGFYEGTIFHRVVPGFVVQGGGYTFDFQKKPTREPVKNESDNGLKNKYMTLSMARTGNVHSATSQFFINLKHNEALNADGPKLGYAVFGKVIEGEEVVERIVQEPRGIFKSFPDAPNAAVRILKAGRGKSLADEDAPQNADGPSSLKDRIAQ